MSQPAIETASATSASIGRPRRSSATQQQQKTRLAWLLLIPTLAVIALVALYPLAQTVYQSFTDARLASGKAPQFIGLRNYSDLLRDTAFRDSIGVTIRFTLLTVIFEFIFGLGVALVINSQFRGRGVVRTAMLVPWAIPTVVSAQMWKWMYSDQYGVINDFLLRFNLINRPIAFIAQPNTSLAAIAAVDIWKTTPFVALLLLAGLQVIPGDVYEAARIDGATAIQQFLRITMPLLRPAILVTLIFRTLDSLRVFDVFYVMFGARQDTQTMAIYNQQNLVSFSDLGYGSAISVAIFAIIGIFVVAYVTFLKVEEA